MSVAGFTKLWSTIIHSTIWDEASHVRVVWITMLAMADRNGTVCASIPGLANASRVTREQCDEALERLSSPDPDSRTQEYDGRRIETIDGGWRVLNYLKYRERRDEEERRIQTREAVRRHRAKKAKSVTVSQGKPRKAQAEAEADTDTDTDRKTPKTPSSSAPRRREAPPQDATDVALWLYCSGKPPAKANAFSAPMRETETGWQYGVRQVELDELARCYPGVDIRMRLENLRSWLRDTPQKRRTYARMSTWLSDRVADWQNRSRRTMPTLEPIHPTRRRLGGGS